MSLNSGVARSAGDESDVPVDSKEALAEGNEDLELRFSGGRRSVSCVMDVTMAGGSRCQVAAGRGLATRVFRAETRRETEMCMPKTRLLMATV